MTIFTIRTMWEFFWLYIFVFEPRLVYSRWAICKDLLRHTGNELARQCPTFKLVQLFLNLWIFLKQFLLCTPPGLVLFVFRLTVKLSWKSFPVLIIAIHLETPRKEVYRFRRGIALRSPLEMRYRSLQPRFSGGEGNPKVPACIQKQYKFARDRS